MSRTLSVWGSMTHSPPFPNAMAPGRNWRLRVDGVPAGRRPRSWTGFPRSRSRSRPGPDPDQPRRSRRRWPAGRLRPSVRDRVVVGVNAGDAGRVEVGNPARGAIGRDGGRLGGERHRRGHQVRGRVDDRHPVALHDWTAGPRFCAATTAEITTATTARADQRRGRAGAGPARPRLRYDWDRTAAGDRSVGSPSQVLGHVPTRWVPVVRLLGRGPGQDGVDGGASSGPTASATLGKGSRMWAYRVAMSVSRSNGRRPVRHS